MPRSLLIVPLMLVGCELEKPPAVAGEHVVYHWDAEENQLCGGTIAAVDRHFEAMTTYYDWPVSERGLEYFWDTELAISVCSGIGKLACARRFSSWTMVLSDSPLDTHELGHTARVGSRHTLGSYVDFVTEGFATRWQSGILEATNVPTISTNFLSEAQLRAVLEANDIGDANYGHAFTWWVALELGYGPAKMAEFVTELQGVSAADEVEAALQRVFGISLAESVTLAKNLPPGTIDDPACVLSGLPTFTWSGGPLVVERDDASCGDEDVVNVSGWGTIWMFALEFPATPTSVGVSVTVPEGVEQVGKSLTLTWCSGELHLAELPPVLSAGAHSPGSFTGMWKLRGRYVGVLQSPLEADGSIVFPRATYTEAAP